MVCSRVCCSVLLPALLVGAAKPAPAQCPQSRIAVSFGGVAHYDLPAGWMDAQSAGTLASTAAVWVVDDFELTGLSPSTTVACTIRLILTGQLAASTYQPYHYAGGYADASIRISQTAGQDSVDAWMSNGAPQESLVETTLELPVVLTAGTGFRLEFFLLVGTDVSSAPSYLRGEIRFDGLPPQAGVRSCAGFVINPTAVVPQTWAHVKALYRNSGR